jgi:hypothetical protein
MTSNDQDERHRKQAKRAQEIKKGDPDAATRASHADRPERANKTDYSKYLTWYREHVHEHLPFAQTVTNWLLVVFTAMLAFIAYQTEAPQVTVRPSPYFEGFTKGGIPREWIAFDNIGHQPAWSFRYGIYMQILDYPLQGTHLTEAQPNSVAIDIYPTNPAGVAVSYGTPFADADFDGVQNGSKQVYVWGTYKYKDFLHIAHKGNFCFAWSAASQAGVCSVERPRWAYGLENDQEPNAQPIPEVPLPRSSASP